MSCFRSFCFLLSFALSLVASAASGQARPASPANTGPDIARLARSVVTILVEAPTGGVQGSGVIVDANGVIATAAHVISGATRGRVRLASGEELKIEGVIDIDNELDVALIRIAGFQLPVAALGNSDSLTLGEHLLAIGAPLGLETSVTDGLLSGTRSDSGRKLLQISIPVSHGSSGGPVFNSRGEVVGIVVLGVRADVGQNLNFALPINSIRGKLALASAKTPTPLPLGAALAPMVNGAAANGPYPSSVVNASLNLDWRALDGAEIGAEASLDRGAKDKRFVQYRITTDPDGNPVFARRLKSTVSVKRSVLVRDDAFADVQVTELTLAPVQTIHESYQQTALLAGLNSTSGEIRIGAGQFSWTHDGQTSGGVVAQGVLTDALQGAALAAMPDSLPRTAFVWVLNPASGSADVVRIEFGAHESVRVPILDEGDTCGSKYPSVKDSTMAIVWADVTLGVNTRRTAVLLRRPHLAVTPGETKCVKLPHMPQ